MFSRYFFEKFPLSFVLLSVCFSLDTAFGGSSFGPLSESGGVYKVSGIENAANLKEFSPLLQLGRSVSVLGMGESIHGSHDFHKARTLFIKLLVQHDGYRALGFEAPWQSSREANRYIQTCQGNPSAALLSLKFPAWFDESTMDLLNWLCQFNQTHQNDPVYLFGFDIQSPEDLPLLNDFLKRVDPNLLEIISPKLGKCVIWNADVLRQVSEVAVDQCVQGLQAAERALKNNHMHYVSLTSEESVYTAGLSIHALKAFQNQALLLKNPSDSISVSQGAQVRDTAMAWTFESLRKKYFPQSKSILYAHNWHIAKDTLEIDFAGGQLADSMGTIIERKYGDRYGAIGLTGYDVDANSIVIGSDETSQPMPTGNNSFELELHNAGYKYAWIDPMQQFLHAKTKYSLCDLNCLGTRIPSKHYSLIFFLDRSGPLTFPSDIECQSPFVCKIKAP